MPEPEKQLAYENARERFGLRGGSDAHATARSASLLHHVRHIRGTAYSGPNKGAEVLPSLKTKLISLLSAAVFMCLGADCALAVNRSEERRVGKASGASCTGQRSREA